MSEVKRFDLETDPTECGCGYKYMLELPTGEYVLASDYDALAARVARYESVLELIASSIRPDGTWNRDREACRQLARDALADGGKHD